MDWTDERQSFDTAAQPADEFLSMLERREREVTKRITIVRKHLDDERAELDRLEAERTHLTALLGLGGRQGEQNVVKFPALADTDKVVELLREVQRPLHYREIAKMLQARGYIMPGGGDPANTLLAKYYNDPRLYRPARGRYAIKPEGKEVRSVGTHRPRRGGDN